MTDTQRMWWLLMLIVLGLFCGWLARGHDKRSK